MVVSIQENIYYELVGAMHLHSDYSDGTLSIPEIARIANQKGLDFVMFSDHNTLESKKLGLEGWYQQVLVLIGCELNDPDDRNHYLAFRIDEEIPTGLWAKEYVKKVKKLGGIGLIAHPAEKRAYFDAYPPYPWTDWDVDTFDGIEIWNQLSEWMEGITPVNFLWRILHPLRSIRFPVWEILGRWDQLNKHRRVVGIGGIDVHAFQMKWFGFLSFEIYPYKVQFKSLRTHLLTQTPLKKENGVLSFVESQNHIFEAILAARCFISNHSLGDARGFQFYALAGDHVFPMGSRLHPKGSVTFYVKTPSPGVIRFLKDGKILYSIKGDSLDYTSQETGVYRVEVFRKRRGWIYSNPIVVLT